MPDTQPSIFIKKEDDKQENELSLLMTVTGRYGILLLVAIALILVAALVVSTSIPINIAVNLEGVITTTHQSRVVTFSQSGMVREVSVAEGDFVQKGETLAVLNLEVGVADILARNSLLQGEEMADSADLEIEFLRPSKIIAPASGIVSDLSIAEGDYVEAGVSVCRLLLQNNENEPFIVALKAPAEKALSVSVGDEVQVSVHNMPVSQYGYLVGSVRAVERENAMTALFGVDDNADGEPGEEVTYVIIIDLLTDADTYRWTKPNVAAEADAQLRMNTMCTVNIFVDQFYPMEQILSVEE